MRQASRALAALIVAAGAAPAGAQDEVRLLDDWTYDPIYASGWSVEGMIEDGTAVGPDGARMGEVENLIFGNDGTLLGLIAEIDGLDGVEPVHVHVPWDEVGMAPEGPQVRLPIGAGTIRNYDVFGGHDGGDGPMREEETATTSVLGDEVVAGPRIFRATDLIGDYVFLEDGARYGYVNDIIVGEGRISAIVIDAAASDRSGFFAYPYSDRGVSPMAGPRYDLPHGAAEVEAIEAFDYRKLQTRGIE